jgi:hypothetical protein
MAGLRDLAQRDHDLADGPGGQSPARLVLLARPVGPRRAQLRDPLAEHARGYVAQLHVAEVRLVAGPAQPRGQIPGLGRAARFDDVTQGVRPGNLHNLMLVLCHTYGVSSRAIARGREEQRPN